MDSNNKNKIACIGYNSKNEQYEFNAFQLEDLLDKVDKNWFLFVNEAIDQHIDHCSDTDLYVNVSTAECEIHKGLSCYIDSNELVFLLTIPRYEFALSEYDAETLATFMPENLFGAWEAYKKRAIASDSDNRSEDEVLEDFIKLAGGDLDEMKRAYKYEEYRDCYDLLLEALDKIKEHYKTKILEIE